MNTDVAPSDKKSSKKGLIIFMVVLIFLELGGIGFLGWLYYDLLQQKQTVVVQLEDTNAEKDQITHELEDLLAQYESLETDNVQIKAELEQEKQRIIELLEDIKKVKRASYVEIKKYKDEAETLRDIMKGFVKDIDSLNTLATTYKNKYTSVQSDYDEKTKAYDSLEDVSEELIGQVNMAAVLSAVNIEAVAINSKSKPVEKIKKTEKIKVCFTIRKNVLAKAGSKWIYMRIARPDDLVIINSPDNLFSFEGSTIAFTERREVNYQNEDIDLCVYWKNNQELVEGIYTVDIFADEKKIGVTTFSLK